MTLFWPEGFYKILMVGTFVFGAFFLKLPIAISMVLAAIAGSIVAGEGLPLRHLVEGTFGYLDTILSIATAGYLAAILFLERAQVQKGRLIVVPFANNMGFTHNSPQEAHPQFIHFSLPDGSTRMFRYGSRSTNPIFQWPNPDVFIHPQSGQKLAGSEKSNLNRAHPGTPDGALTQRLAYALRQLVIAENVDLAFDLHEASPEYPVVNAIVAHERSMELAAMVAIEMETAGIPIRLEPSPKNLRGLTHREWGDATNSMPILMETGNPSQGRLRGKTNEELVLTGRDKYYAWASKLGLLFIPYEEDQSIGLRIARHVTAIQSFFDAIGFCDPTKEIVIYGIPKFNELLHKGLGSFLSPLNSDNLRM
ncbi:succinylglutamate desuccinylase/aspartoacylase domain-containing protein [Acetomicrobium sp. UBA5826]|uniref:succinylglutamate desuccinylase/aspartoacylase domain-containing protein n=1 Tax=Acetomicrobium sp. UBA5826 TaxID=1946039 RepID=UPI00257D37A3|nr:succinylglutamate desuccinylase/aspartoacylase family protein [Acetomicrobium sp. UBA5826]